MILFKCPNQFWPGLSRTKALGHQNNHPLPPSSTYNVDNRAIFFLLLEKTRYFTTLIRADRGYVIIRVQVSQLCLAGIAGI